MRLLDIFVFIDLILSPLLLLGVQHKIKHWIPETMLVRAKPVRWRSRIMTYTKSPHWISLAIFTSTPLYGTLASTRRDGPIIRQTWTLRQIRLVVFGNQVHLRTPRQTHSVKARIRRNCLCSIVHYHNGRVWNRNGWSRWEAPPLIYRR
jgi:hypothetical protein